ncbi:hypothetical protein L3X38_035602 [Prunus dulcis]|uniref:DCD domain-containing protein n=1 Tax=Prunus dulcis TaxID=3755 RepID=A0AAD4YZP3_PRUDU|nr:hypothetical protein L3X38_035602 [Prunus dulcis]
MELDDNYMETDNRKEINSPAVVLNNSESSEQIPSPAEASNNPESSEQIPSPAEASKKPDSSELKTSSAEAFSGPESAKMKMSSPAEVSNKPDVSEKKIASPAEASNSGKKTPRSLKGKAKIVKKTPIHNSLKTSKGTTSSQVNGRKRRRNRGNNESSNKREEDAKKMNSKREKQENITNEKHAEKSHRAQKNPGKIDESEKSRQNQQSTEKRRGSDKSVKSQRNSEKHDEKREKLGGLIFMCSGKTKPDCFHYRIMGVSMAKKDLVLGIKPGLKLFLFDFDLKLLYGVYKASSSGGLKLEPKAFGGAFPAQVRFNVEKDCLPLPESVFKKAIQENYNEKKKFKTELTVRQVRKLTALFRPAQVHSTALATHSPVQAKVRDRGVHEGARESIPHAHRDAHARDPYANGDARSYPVLAHERDQHVKYRDVASVRREETSHDLYLTEKEYRAYGLRGERRNVSPRIVPPALEARHREYEREHLARQPNLIYREAVPAHQENVHNLSPRIVPPALEARHREYEREHLARQPNLIYREAVPAHRENVHSDPLYLNDRDYPAYTHGARHELPPATSATAVDAYARDPYYGYSYYGSSSLDPYLAPQRREEVPSGSFSVVGRRENHLIETDPPRRETDRVERLYSTHAFGGRRENYLIETNPVLRRETDPVLRRETDRGERLYSMHAAPADAASGYNRTENYQATKADALPAPVSSRYAFAGPSYSYR